MAFCPECGKAVAPESASCANCGFALPKTEQKAAAGARFKGTVMMTAPIVDTKPANVNAQKTAPAAQQKVAVNAAASAVAQQPKPASSGGRGSAKATMIGAGVSPELIAAAHSQAASAAKIGAKAPAAAVARAGGAQAEPKLTAAGLAQPQAKSGGAQHRRVPEAAQTKRSAPPAKETAPKLAAEPTKELGSSQTNKVAAAAQTKELGSPQTGPKLAASPINPKAASQAGSKVAAPQTNPKAAVPQTNPKAAPLQAAPSVVSGTANTDEPPPPASPSVRAMMNVPISQPPEAQFAATQAALPGPPPRPAHLPQHEPSVVVDAEAEVVPTPAVVVQAERVEPQPRQERYLPGDPMAPQPATPMRAQAPRTTIPGDDEIIVPREERKWLYWAVCGAVVLVVLLLAIGLF